MAQLNSMQPRYNLPFQLIEAELLPLALDQGFGVIS
jgi:aryl-alcohol dehydrogenase-like predicted oxidoreductase